MAHDPDKLSTGKSNADELIESDTMDSASFGETADSFERELGAALAVDEGPALLQLEGRVIAGRYRLEKLLGRGGMGQVYRATHLQTGGLHAVKLLLPGNASREKVRQRFQLEAKNAAALRHPNSVRVTDFGFDEGLLYLVMEHVDGESLQDALERTGPFSEARTVHVVSQILKALWEAHEHPKRIVHRDIKAANILLSEVEGNPDFVKVLDFGISRALDATGADTQGIVGSPHSMSPEQWEGRPVDPRADLYSVGCLTYELLAGGSVFEGGSLSSLGYQHVHQTPPPLGERARGVSEHLIAWTERMMAKKPEDRFDSARAALLTLEHDQASPEPRDLTSQGAELFPTRAGFRGPRVLAVLLGLVLVVALGGYFIWRAGGDQLPDRLDSQSGTPREAATAPAPRVVPPVAEEAAAPEVLRLCDPSPKCELPSRRWCNAEGQERACCGAGLVPDGSDGICVCAPGGTRIEEAQSAGCEGPKSDAKSSVKATMVGLSPKWKVCYQNELDTSTQLQGRVVLGFSIGPHGEAHGVRVKEGTLPSAEVQRCILNTVTEARFEPPTDGWVDISYPVTLKLDP